MAREPARWIQVLLRAVAFRASDAELGDVMEEYATESRGVLWLCRQLLSTLRSSGPHIAIPERKTLMLSNVWTDVWYAARMFRRNPGFAAAAVAPIALGIGINTGIFSVLNSLALRELPAPDAAELVSVHQQLQGITQRRVHGARSLFSMPEYRAYRDGTGTLSGAMAYSMPWTLAMGGNAPQEIEALTVSCNYFDVLQLRLSIGPGFIPASCDAPNAAPAVVLSHDLWTRAFASDPDIVGKTIAINGHHVGIVGVTSEGFAGIDLLKVVLFASPSTIALIRPEENYRDDPHTSWLSVVGRRKKGVSLAQVRAELAVIANQIDQQQPGRTTTLTVAPATSMSLPEARRDLFSVATVVLTAFGLVLLIACANVANLLLARAAGRTREIAVRLSIGASRRRIIQQLLTESGMIALAGGVAGSILAWWSFRGLLAFLLSSLPGAIPPLRIDATPDLTVLWFAVAITALTVLVFGLAPALQASKQDVQTALKQEMPGAGRRTAGWLRGMLVGAQVAVCMVLLISAGLLLRALYTVQTVDPGFDYRQVAVVSFDLRGRGPDQRTGAFERALLERIASLPGVEGVAAVDKTPLSPGRREGMVRLPGEDQWRETGVNGVSEDYFSVIGIPVVRGRTFTTADRGDSPRVAIISEATARRFWPGSDPVGRTLIMGLTPNQEVSLEIVGIAKDAQVTGIAEADSTYVYLPAGPGTERGLELVRSGMEFAGVATAIRALARELDPGVVVRVSRLEENLDFWRTVSQLVAGLSGSLGALALLLASVGVYGVVSYVVSRRRREVGIRMALGATARDVQRLIVRQTLRPVAVGALIGVAATAAASRVLQSVLFGVSPLDPVAFVGAPLFLLAIALAATLVPTRAAVRVDPMTTLRYE